MLETPELSAPSPIQNETGVRSFDRIPQRWGPRFSTGFADLAVIRPGPDDADAQADAHFLLIFLSPQRGRELRLGSPRTTIFDAPSGSVEIIPAQASYFSRWQHPMECALLTMEPAQLSQFAEREFDVGRVELRPLVPGTVDRTAARIASLLRDEMLLPHLPGRLYVESLATALLFHTVKSHSSLNDQSDRKPWRGGLSPRAWRNVDSFIRENLSADMALVSLAGQIGLSYSHFLRAFRQTSGVSPHRYIMQLRVEEAQRLAASTLLPLKQISSLCGFASQSHMTTVMKSLLHTTPGEIRRQRRSHESEMK